jgi:hypothetical protein
MSTWACVHVAGLAIHVWFGLVSTGVPGSECSVQVLFIRNESRRRFRQMERRVAQKESHVRAVLSFCAAEAVSFFSLGDRQGIREISGSHSDAAPEAGCSARAVEVDTISSWTPDAISFFSLGESGSGGGSGRSKGESGAVAHDMQGFTPEAISFFSLGSSRVAMGREEEEEATAAGEASVISRGGGGGGGNRGEEGEAGAVAGDGVIGAQECGQERNAAATAAASHRHGAEVCRKEDGALIAEDGVAVGSEGAGEVVADQRGAGGGSEASRDELQAARANSGHVTPGRLRPRRDAAVDGGCGCSNGTASSSTTKGMFEPGVRWRINQEGLYTVVGFATNGQKGCGAPL